MKKIRMQILLDAKEKKMLEREAEIRKTSIGQVIRDAVAMYGKEKLGGENEFTEDDPLWKIVGLVPEELTDLSEEHDYYIYGTPIKKQRKK